MTHVQKIQYPAKVCKNDTHIQKIQYPARIFNVEILQTAIPNEIF